MEKLEQYLKQQISFLSDKDHNELVSRLANLISAYPFNQYEFIISTLLGLDKLSTDDYYTLRDDYIGRNMFLYLYEISAPRGFGETWGQSHLKELVPQLEKPSKKKDPNYSGEYDFLLDDTIKIEVKASRAVDFDSNEPLYIKALSSNSKKRFDMNFQQIKPYCCDVFVWIAVWRDLIKYWVLSSNEVLNDKNYSIGQHRGNENEGQLHINERNIKQYNKYLSPPDKLLRAFRRAYKRQINIINKQDNVM